MDEGVEVPVSVAETMASKGPRLPESSLAKNQTPLLEGLQMDTGEDKKRHTTLGNIVKSFSEQRGTIPSRVDEASIGIMYRDRKDADVVAIENMRHVENLPLDNKAVVAVMRHEDGGKPVLALAQSLPDKAGGGKVRLRFEKSNISRGRVTDLRGERVGMRKKKQAIVSEGSKPGEDIPLEGIDIGVDLGSGVRAMRINTAKDPVSKDLERMTLDKDLVTGDLRKRRMKFSRRGEVNVQLFVVDLGGSGQVGERPATGEEKKGRPDARYESGQPSLQPLKRAGV